MDFSNLALNAVVYTAIYGDYDYLKPLPDLSSHRIRVDGICYSDKPLAADGWRTIVAPRPEWHPRYQAKFWKLNPHLALSDYDFSIWVDAGVKVTSRNFVRDILTEMGDSPVAFFPHRWRSTVADELQAHLPLRKYKGFPLREQVTAYFEAGFPDDLGLLECTVIPRWHMSESAIMIGRAWWEENLRWSYADQLSLPFVLWRLGESARWIRLRYNLDTQPWFQIASWRDDG